MLYMITSLDPIVKLLQVIVPSLPQVINQKRRLRNFAKILFSLNYELELLIENGKELLSLIRSNVKLEYKVPVLEQHYLEQVRILTKINKKLQLKDEFQAILSVHSIHLKTLESFCNEKLVRIQFLHLRNLQPPEEKVLNQEFGRKLDDNLEKIEQFTKNLKHFIVNNFKIEDVV